MKGAGLSLTPVAAPSRLQHATVRGAVPHRDPMVIHLNTVGLKLDEAAPSDDSTPRSIAA